MRVKRVLSEMTPGVAGNWPAITRSRSCFESKDGLEVNWSCGEERAPLSSSRRS